MMLGVHLGELPGASSSAGLAEVFVWFLSVVSVQDKSLFRCSSWQQQCLSCTSNQRCCLCIWYWRCPGRVYTAAVSLAAWFNWLCWIKWGGNVMGCLCHSFESGKKYSPSLQIYFCGDLTRRVTWADFDKQITRAFWSHASRRLSPMVLILAIRARFGSMVAFWCPRLGTRLHHQGLQLLWLGDTLLGHHPLDMCGCFWAYRVSCGLRICLGAKMVPYVHSPTCWWRLGPRPRFLAEGRVLQSHLGSRHNWGVCLPPLPLPFVVHVVDWTRWSLWTQPLPTASTSKRNVLGVRPSTELGPGFGHKHPIASLTHPHPRTQRVAIVNLLSF